TQSKYGVFGYIDERGDLVVPTMAMGAWDECPVSDKRIVFPHETWGDSSWPRAIREGKVIYSNQRSTLTPERHIPIDRHISMPIIHRGRVVGLFQMANKPTDYNEKDLTLLQTVTDHVAPILDARLRSERKERERQRVEDALSQSEAGLAKAQEIAHLGNWDWNIVTNESLWSDEAYRIFGLRPQEIRVTYEAFLAMIHPDDREAVRHAVKRALSLPDSTYSVEYRVRRPDGSECFVHELGNVTFDDDGRPVRILGIVQDVTEHKQVEAALHLARETAEAATQAKSKFLASMSHELRTPLNAIIGFSEILEDRTFGPINEKQARYVGHVLSSGRHLLDLINDILDLSKVEAGKMELEPSEVDLTALLEGSLVMIKEKALTHGISLELDVADDLSGLRVWADERKLKQVMFNLLSNAAKFTPDHGAIKVRAWRDREEFFCSVSDTGIGLEAEDLERVFGAFEQVDSSYARDQQGTGLGLALSKRMAELHGGRIWAESAGPDQGSTFILSLPIRPSAKKGASATSPAAADETGGQGIETTSANEADTRPRILVVEDNLPAQELLVRHLADIGFAVHCALDGEEAIYKARELKPVAITLDILLPDKNGLDVLRELKALPETKDIPVLVISITDDGPKALSLGAAGYIRKPVTKRELIKAVAAMVPGAARKG
ncbi:MAG: PAS domain-containing protein, partial [Proteobacteria bacterium]|nr:PAS domain-containing protein [Pseudomonadota bacterium]